MEEICVIMSTYNGEKYLREQLDSILQQKDVGVKLIVRDDGSKDSTANILKEYGKRFRNLNIILGENKGYACSFFEALSKADNDCAYYAFADQDDVWDLYKLSRAVDKLKQYEDIPTLYSCNLKLVNEDLRFIGMMEAPTEKDFDKGRYLIDKYSYGCAMVFNKRLKELVQNHLPSCKVSHDNWVGLIAVFCGKYIFDEQPYIAYRQHTNNVTGGRNGFVSVWKRRIKNLTKMKELSRASIARELLLNFGDYFDLETEDLLHMVADYKNSFGNRMRFFRDKRTTRKSREKNFIFRILILLSLA